MMIPGSFQGGRAIGGVARGADRLDHGERNLVIDQAVLQIDHDRVVVLPRHRLRGDRARDRQPAVQNRLAAIPPRAVVLSLGLPSSLA